MSFSCSVYEIQTQIFFGLDHNMKKSMIITIYCVFGCQIASYELDTPVYINTVLVCFIPSVVSRPRCAEHVRVFGARREPAGGSTSI